MGTSTVTPLDECSAKGWLCRRSLGTMADNPDNNNAEPSKAKPRDSLQWLRIQRTAFAALASLGVVGVIAMLAWTGLLPIRWFLSGTGAIALQCLVFLGLLLGGFNKRFKDPSMTIAQMFGAAMTLLVIAHAASPGGRSVVMMLIPLAFAFATFRFGFVRLMRHAGALVLLMALEAALYLETADPAIYPPVNALPDAQPDRHHPQSPHSGRRDRPPAAKRSAWPGRTGGRHGFHPS